MLFLTVCASCQEEMIEQTLVLDSYKATGFDLKYILENADSISYGTYRIVEHPNNIDSIKGKNENTTRGGIVSGEEHWVNGKCYIIDGPYAVTQMVTHPSINSPIPGNGFCGIIANVYYNYSKVYEWIAGTTSAYYYTCVKNIERVTTQLYNASNYYLLWQNDGTRAYCPSSNYDPVLYPQEWIYLIFDGRIVGERGFISPYEDTDIEVNYTTSFRIPME